MACGIYLIVNPKGKIYVGQSIDLNRRESQYRNNKDTSQNKIYNSIKKYGWGNHIFKIIEECQIEDLNKEERFYQEVFDVVENGLNCCFVQDDFNKGKRSEETKKKSVIHRKKDLNSILN